jgi:hypothetical protein
MIFASPTVKTKSYDLISFESGPVVLENISFSFLKFAGIM